MHINISILGLYLRCLHLKFPYSKQSNYAIIFPSLLELIKMKAGGMFNVQLSYLAMNLK